MHNESPDLSGKLWNSFFQSEKLSVELPTTHGSCSEMLTHAARTPNRKTEFYDYYIFKRKALL